MTSSSSLYGSTSTTGTVSSSNYTTLYSGGAGPAPQGNLVIPGTLTVNGCAILTNCSTFDLLPTTATTINFGLEATALNIGANTGITTINNQLALTNYSFPVADGTANQVLTTDGAGNVYWALPGGGGSQFGNITIGITTDNTIDTTTGDLFITSNTGEIEVTGNLTATGFTTTDYVKIPINNTSTAIGIGGPIADVGAGSDYWHIGGYSVGGTGNNDGALEIATANNGTEPIYVRQYTGGGTGGQWPHGNTIQRTLTLLDNSGNTQFPGDLTINDDQTVGPARVTAYSSAISSYFEWDGVTWAFNNNLEVAGQTYLYDNGDVRTGNDIFVGGADVIMLEGTTGSPVNNASFEVERGTSLNTRLLWNESTDRWQFTNDGTNYTNMPVSADSLTYAGMTLNGSLRLNGSSSGYSNFSAPATGSNINYVLPSAQGAASTVLTNDGSGNLTWALPGGGGSTFGNVTVGVATDNTVSTTTGDLILDSATNTVNVTATLELDGQLVVKSNNNINMEGRYVIDSATLTTSTTTADQVLATYTAATIRSTKFIIQIESGTDFQIVEILAVHNGTNAFFTTYGDVRTGPNLATFNMDINSGNFRLLTTPVNAVTTYRVAIPAAILA